MSAHRKPAQLIPPYVPPASGGVEAHADFVEFLNTHGELALFNLLCLVFDRPEVLVHLEKARRAHLGIL